KKRMRQGKVLWRGKAVTMHDIRVYKLISLIPRGKVVTYGSVAKAIQSGPRGVGQALRRNPFAPEVPCHRVVNANRLLHGFRGSTDPKCADLKDKHALLTGEGVMIDHDKVGHGIVERLIDIVKVDADCMYVFTAEDIAASSEKDF
ncbi:hypothetical protein THRCLA_20524, partial [Thraustotheca clavata]